MNITIIGTGYVGLITGSIFSDRSNTVYCVDSNQTIIENLNQCKLHIYEPRLKELIIKNKDKGLFFTTNLNKAIKNSDIVFMCVGTPSDEDGSFNLKYIKSVAEGIGEVFKECNGFKIVVCKSTVPQGTHKVVSDIINKKSKENHQLEWEYVSNPETLAEGSAVSNFSSPDRIIIGTNSSKALEVMKQLYHSFVLKDSENRFKIGSPADAELAKLYSNTALATRIAMVNEFARIADHTDGADMDTIRRMLCSDSRIGYKFMYPSPGYGGSCFPKDILGLVSQSKLNEYQPLLLNTIDKSNELQKDYIASKVLSVLGPGKKVAIWGLTFKPNTDDMRESASIKVINKLLENGYNISVYDPKDNKAKEIFKDKIIFHNQKYSAIENTDAVILLTEWRQFDSPDFKLMKEKMNGNYIFDFRNRWLPKIVNSYNFNYYGVGRNYPLE